MKRIAALEPFSRDHNDGLILARDLKAATRDAAVRTRKAWEAELKDHFDEEERLLGPLITPSMLMQVRKEHEDIGFRIERLPSGLAMLGSALESHIRWEERVVFPYIEEHATDSQRRSLLVETRELEMRRWSKDANRAKLVGRRWQKMAEGPR